MMLPYAFTSNEFGPIITGIEARALPALSERGRIPFFDDNPLWFWFFGQHSGLLPNVFEHPLVVIGLFLPILLQTRHRLKVQITSKVALLPQIILSSFGMFVAAHTLLYKLFAPARYTRYSLRFVMIVAVGIALTLILDALCRWVKQHQSDQRQLIGSGLIVFLGIVLIFYPHFLKNFPNSNYIVGKAPALYEFFQKQPKDTLIASLSTEADNLPTFSRRAILIGWEYAVPYHLSYDSQIRQRATDLIRAQYTQNLAEVQNFIQTYGVDFFMLDRAAFTPEYIRTNPWFVQWQSIAQDILASLEQGSTPALVSTLKRCAVLETQALIVLQAECIATPQK